MNTVAIVGVGLIGGSFALALKKAGFAGKILGVSSPATIEAALACGAIDIAATLPEAAQADLIYLAQPIGRILDTIDQLSRHVKSDALVTDAGSTKTRIVNHATDKLRGCHFIGGHPLAGKETRGVESAEAGLFRNRSYVLTPRSEADLSTPQARDFIFWLEKIGTKCIFLSPEDHDETVAFTSHLPQLASTALASTLAAQIPLDELFEVSGTGLADTTRLALSSFEIWRDILITNRSAIDFALAMYIDKLVEFRENLTNLQLREEFDVAAGAARKIRRGRSGP